MFMPSYLNPLNNCFSGIYPIP